MNEKKAKHPFEEEKTPKSPRKHEKTPKSPRKHEKIQDEGIEFSVPVEEKTPKSPRNHASTLWQHVFSPLHLLLMIAVIGLVVVACRIALDLYPKMKGTIFSKKEWADIGVAWSSSNRPEVDKAMDRIAKSCKDMFAKKTVRIVPPLKERKQGDVIESGTNNRCKSILVAGYDVKKLSERKYEVLLSLEWYNIHTEELLQCDSTSSIIEGEDSDAEIANRLDKMEATLKEQFQQTLKIREQNPTLVMSTGEGKSEDEALKRAQQAYIEREVGVIIDSISATKDGLLIRDDIVVKFCKDLPPIRQKKVAQRGDGLYQATIFCEQKRKEMLDAMLGDEKLQEYFKHQRISFLFANEQTAESKAVATGVVLLKEKLTAREFRVFDVGMIREQYQKMKAAFDIGLSPDLDELYQKYPTSFFILIDSEIADNRIKMAVTFKTRNGQELDIFTREAVVAGRNLDDVVREMVEMPDGVAERMMAGLIKVITRFGSGYPYHLQFMGFENSEHTAIDNMIGEINGVVWSSSPLTGERGVMEVEISCTGSDPKMLLENSMRTGNLSGVYSRLSNWIRVIKDDRICGIRKTWIMYISIALALLMASVLIYRCARVLKLS